MRAVILIQSFLAIILGTECNPWFFLLFLLSVPLIWQVVIDERELHVYRDVFGNTVIRTIGGGIKIRNQHALAHYIQKSLGRLIEGKPKTYMAGPVEVWASGEDIRLTSPNGRVWLRGMDQILEVVAKL